MPLARPYSELIPLFLFRQGGLAWECSFCAKLFSISAEEAELRKSILPPDFVRREFENHDCILTLHGRIGGVRRAP